MNNGGLCECEHIDHFELLIVDRGAGPDREHIEPAKLHPYGSVPATQDVGTPRGSFCVCEYCATHCLQGLDS